jgi:biopolymer transport protein TolR
MAAGPLRPGDHSDEAYPPIAEINVTPFVDVMLVLLIVFMVTAPLMMVGVPVELPKTSAERVGRPKAPVIVSVARDGRLYLRSDPLTPPALVAKLRELAAADPSAVVYVRGDRAIAYGRVMEVMGLVASSGFAKVSLIAEPDLASGGG